MSVDPRVIRARSFLGTPFRLHGRDCQSGVDCVGFVALLYGRSVGVPVDYAMRNSEGARWLIVLDACAGRRTDGAVGVGDILLMQAGPAQYHLGVWTGDGLIHADAGLRRVVETPGQVQWPIIAVWHAPEDIQ